MRAEARMIENGLKAINMYAIKFDRLVEAGELLSAGLGALVAVI
jgi:hypothetical protein